MADLPLDLTKDRQFQQSKTDIEPFAGGVEVDLNREIEGGGTLREKFAVVIKETLEEELLHRLPLIEKIQKWQKQFKGIKGEKFNPYPGCSNLAIPMTRWLLETVFVRVRDPIISQQKIYIVEATDPAFVDIAPQIEEALNWWAVEVADFQNTLLSPLLQGFKMGLSGVLLEYVRKKRPIVTYATERDLADKNIKKYKDANGNKIVKVPMTEYTGPYLEGVSIEDIILSSDSSSFQDAFLAGYKTSLRPSQFEVLVKNGFYPITDDEKASVMHGDEMDETKQARKEDENIEVEPTKRTKIDIWKLWIRYDVDDDGEEDDVVVSFHQDTGTILRAVYNPIFYNFRPLRAFVPDPVEYSFYGTGGCEKLEDLQEELDSLHNQRMDRANQLNAPVWEIQEDSPILEQKQKIYPGAELHVREIGGDIAEVGGRNVYPDTVALENLVNQYAQLTIGVSPHVMGQPSTERPVARETLALIEELNKKYKYYIDNTRKFIEGIGRDAIEMISQYQPTYKYKVNGEERQLELFKYGNLRDGIKIKLRASSEMLNTEVRIQRNLTLYQLLSDYSTKLAGMAQMLPQVPPALQKLILEVDEMGAKILKRIVRDIGDVDAEELVPSLKKILTPEDLIPQPTQQMPPTGQPPTGTTETTD